MIDIFGYIGTVLILYSFTIENIYKLRLINSIGSVFWIIYGIGIMAGPTILVNSCVLCIHIYWFIKQKKKKSANNTKSTKAIRY
jgi:NADH:ubiquinone oxidoreductase subunit 6 (subunit J)